MFSGLRRRYQPHVIAGFRSISAFMKLKTTKIDQRRPNSTDSAMGTRNNGHPAGNPATPNERELR